MAFTTDQDHFALFGATLRESLKRYGEMNDAELLALQRQQLETLFGLEKSFREALLSHSWGPEVYELFIRKICVENGNILTARPFFRERQEVCVGPISTALERRRPRDLYRYNFNYQFVLFALSVRNWPANSWLRVLAREIEAVRRDIVELNTPLAISQARIFWSKAPAKAPSTHLQYMDFVQISCDGLISAVDKFVLPSPGKFRGQKQLNEQFRKFRPMAIQRMVGNFIENFNETMVHFWPKDKRKIYKANKFLARCQGPVDPDKLIEFINADGEGGVVDPQYRTTVEEIGTLLQAATASTLASESSSTDGDEERENPLDRCAAEENARPDVSYEKSESEMMLMVAIQTLPVIDQKLLKMKGVGQSL